MIDQEHFEVLQLVEALQEPIVMMLGFVWLVVWAVRRTGSSPNNADPGGGATRPQTAREILDQRFARGEITREQYQQMKQDLEG